MTAPQGSLPLLGDPAFLRVLNHADDNLVLAQRLGEWISRAPELEEDIALGNIALDHLGVARALLTHAGRLEGAGRDEDDLAMGRPERGFTNILLVEQPNGDFAMTMARQFLFDTYQLELWERLSHDQDEVLAGIAEKAHKEARYHFRHSSAWLVRLGDGTEESNRRAQAALDSLWRFTEEMFSIDDSNGLEQGWLRRVTPIIDAATLIIPADTHQRSGGRRGLHTEHLGVVVAEMQWMHRAYPEVEW